MIMENYNLTTSPNRRYGLHLCLPKPLRASHNRKTLYAMGDEIKWDQLCYSMEKEAFVISLNKENLN